LPGYFDFVDDSAKRDGEMSPKAQKRQKLEDKHANFASLLRPQNAMAESFGANAASQSDSSDNDGAQ
jgi:hypothetical protein